MWSLREEFRGGNYNGGRSLEPSFSHDMSHLVKEQAAPIQLEMKKPPVLAMRTGSPAGRSWL